MRRPLFRRLVRQTFADLPPDIRRLLANVAIVIKWQPSPADLRQTGLGPGETLFGLYQGTPLPQRSSYDLALPDRIVLYQEPLERTCHDRDTLREEVRRTLLHEIAHYLGIEEERLEEMGLG
ncbi:MAG TPA: metallopeptidase family protein [Dehalococcoidia bacterium]|nr:metallopeptidase family protein [Dehalococcoidia bacterium]